MQDSKATCIWADMAYVSAKSREVKIEGDRTDDDGDIGIGRYIANGCA